MEQMCCWHSDNYIWHSNSQNQCKLSKICNGEPGWLEVEKNYCSRGSGCLGNSWKLYLLSLMSRLLQMGFFYHYVGDDFEFLRIKNCSYKIFNFVETQPCSQLTFSNLLLVHCAFLKVLLVFANPPIRYIHSIVLQKFLLFNRSI